MNLELERKYLDKGTNGAIYLNGEFICHTIELPWLDNNQGESCIPSGKYKLSKRHSLKHKNHLEILDVPGRKNILIHPANDALKELKGCIAPVGQLTGTGTGIFSRKATNELYSLVVELMKSEAVYLIIK